MTCLILDAFLKETGSVAFCLFDSLNCDSGLVLLCFFDFPNFQNCYDFASSSVSAIFLFLFLISTSFWCCAPILTRRSVNNDLKFFTGFLKLVLGKRYLNCF